MKGVGIILLACLSSAKDLEASLRTAHRVQKPLLYKWCIGTLRLCFLYYLLTNFYKQQKNTIFESLAALI